MNIERESEELYFDENEPQIQESSIRPQADIVKEQNRFGSCIFSRETPKSAPLHLRRSKNTSDPRTDYFSAKKYTDRHTLNRKLTFDTSSSPANDSPSPTGKHSSLVYRSLHSSKKPPSPYRPSMSPTTQHQSQSPNRKNLYWQAYLLEPRKAPTPSAYLPRTLKPFPDTLQPPTAQAYIAMMADSHEILADKNIHEKRQIASLTKIMTAYTVIKICNSSGIKIKQHKVTIHSQASWMQGTSANLKVDQEFYIEDLLYGLLLPSGNDAGVALAQHFGKFLSFRFTKDQEEADEGRSSMERFEFYKEYYDTEYGKDSIRLFVFEMNKNSYKIGLKNTHFANPTGLSNSKNYSTAHDIALLTSHCLKNHTMRDIFKRKVYVCSAINQKLSYEREVQWKNTNKHLYEFRECIGAKTGITPTAGPCLSSAYKVLNREVVVVVLNSSSIDDRYEDARNIYKWCRRNMRVF